MEQTAELAGYLAAIAVVGISGGDCLVPIIAFERADGARQINLLASEEKLEDAVAQGREWLALNPESALRAVLIYDALIPRANSQTKALVIEARHFTPERERMMLVFGEDGMRSVPFTPDPEGFVMGVPYRHAKSPEGFAVYEPEFLIYEGPETLFESLDEAFFRGVAQHEKGAAMWTAKLIQSQ